MILVEIFDGFRGRQAHYISIHPELHGIEPKYEACQIVQHYYIPCSFKLHEEALVEYENVSSYYKFKSEFSISGLGKSHINMHTNHPSIKKNDSTQLLLVVIS